MPLILRVDVDKPFGHSNLIRKISSKVFEDIIGTPPLKFYKYLSHLIEFLEYCNSEKISGFIYHRICTSPNKKVTDLLIDGKHKFGLHAENTKSYETFLSEFHDLKKRNPKLIIESFTKHGSGQLKLGKYHYPIYEPAKYREWSKKANIKYHSGNGIAQNTNDLLCKNDEFDNVFWLEREYRNEDLFEIEKIIELAKTEKVVVLIHPCNYHSFKVVKDDFQNLVNLSKKEKVDWIVY